MFSLRLFKMMRSGLFKNSLVYSATSILQKMIGFILLPVYTRYMTPAEYGIANLVNSLAIIISVLFGFTMQWAVYYFYSKYQNDKQLLAKVIGTIVTFSLVNLTCLILLMLSCLQIFEMDELLKGVPAYPYFLLGILAVAGNIVFEIYQFFLQAQQNGRRYGLVALLFFSINVSFNLYFVVVLKMGVLGFLVGNALASALSASFALVCFLPHIKFTILWEPLKEYLRYWLPLIPHSIGNWLFVTVDRVLLNQFFNVATVGLYSIAFQFGSIISIVSVAFNQAYAPWFIERTKEGEQGRQKAAIVGESIVAIIMLVALAVSLFSREVLWIMTSEPFHEAWQIVPWIAFGYSFNAIYYVYVDVLFLRNTTYVPIITFTSSLFSVAMNFAIISAAGSYGAAFTVCASLFLASLLAMYFANRVERIGFSALRMYILNFGGLVVSTLAFLPTELNYAWVYKFATWFLTALIVYGIYKKKLDTLRADA